MSENTLKSGSMFPPELVTEMFNAVNGHSAIAKLAVQKPLPFNGEKSFIFDLEGEASLVGESEAKPAGKATMNPVVVTPLKFIYQARVSDEFINAAREVQINYLKTFGEGFSRIIARGLDLAAFHGVNPATNISSAKLTDNNFDGVIENIVTYDASTPDDNLDAAIQLLTAAQKSATGIAMSPAFGAAMSKVKVNGVAQYPEFRFGGQPEKFAGYTVDVNGTVSKYKSDEDVDIYTDHAIIGDFQNLFRWGYAKNMPLEIIEYGDPDGAGRDLKRYNEVLLCTEAYIGWGIMDKTAFAIINKKNT